MAAEEVPVEKFYITYDEIHQIVQDATALIGKEFKPTLMIAIG